MLSNIDDNNINNISFVTQFVERNDDLSLPASLFDAGRLPSSRLYHC